MWMECGQARLACLDAMVQGENEKKKEEEISSSFFKVTSVPAA
jgi:hypothetical protein